MCPRPALVKSRSALVRSAAGGNTPGMAAWTSGWTTMILSCAWLTSCAASIEGPATASARRSPFVFVLGIAQDAGYPQTACRRACCAAVAADPARRRLVAGIAIVDPQSSERWIIDCTPDFGEQLLLLDAVAPPAMARDGFASQPLLEGIFLTHAHIGHYTGLMELGREATGATRVPVYAMPRMRSFLERNGPWRQLVELGNVELRPLAAETPVALNERIRVTPLVVPHRDEYSETVGFRINGPGRSILYIPDIDKWERWEQSIEEEVKRVDVALLDGTFFSGDELGGRDMAEIPHPSVRESMERLSNLPPAERGKVRFIHLNHTNPLLDVDGEAMREVRGRGFGVAAQGEVMGLGGLLE